MSEEQGMGGPKRWGCLRSRMLVHSSGMLWKTAAGRFKGEEKEKKEEKREVVGCPRSRGCHGMGSPKRWGCLWSWQSPGTRGEALTDPRSPQMSWCC